MATENPMRIVDSSGAGKWSPSRGTASLASASAVTDELGLLLRGHTIDRNPSKIAPNRSGSAPPSIEGSFAAFGDLIYSHSTALSTSLEHSQSEVLKQDNPLYSAHLNSHPHTISRSNMTLYARLGGFQVAITGDCHLEILMAVDLYTFLEVLFSLTRRSLNHPRELRMMEQIAVSCLSRTWFHLSVVIKAWLISYRRISPGHLLQYLARITPQAMLKNHLIMIIRT